MWDEDVVENFKAASETVLPESSKDGIHLLVAEQLDKYIAGFPVLVSGLLDAFASEAKAGARFSDLDPAERGSVFRTMINDPAPDVQDIVNALFFLTLGQNYAESNPRHDEVWLKIGYKGPSLGFPNFRDADA